MTDRTDEWVAAARGGSEEAFGELVLLHQARLRAYLGQFVRDRDAADDLAQEAFITAFRSLGDYEGRAPFATWLIGIARYQALMHFRKSKRYKAHEAGYVDATLGELLARRLEDETPSWEGDDPVRVQL